MAKPNRSAAALRAAALAALLALGLDAVASAPRSPPAPQAEPARGEPAPAHPVLLELFTSQGCSSCPPADRLLARLAEESDGAIVPLAFHVDSWDRLGWKDPFASRAWTLRHEAYSRGLDELPYTPQAVVAGRVAMVGSNEEAIRAAVAAAAALPAAELSLTLEPSARRFDATVVVELPPSLRRQKLHLLVALFETGLETPVRRGENGGRTLGNDYVVRRLERAARLSPRSPGRSEHSARFELEAGWDRTRLGVAAFLQDPDSLAVHGVAALELADLGTGS